MQNPHGIVLFSGGLDSLLAALLLKQQGLRILCLHFITPFFGSPEKIAHWRKLTGLDIEAVDATAAFTQMLASRPPHGTGRALNPCVDCKILLLRLGRERLAQTGASFLATGEVRGQRPMSQRTDALNTIMREAEVKDILLRPLSALLLPPTPMETSGLVDRSRLMRISGRGRNEQLELARNFGIDEIPTPGGGCLLTEKENCRRYWPLLNRYWQNPGGKSIEQLAEDFQLANLGRMLLKKDSAAWLSIGRNKNDNERLIQAARPDDILLRLPFPGPLALARAGTGWTEKSLYEACAILASYSPRARSMDSPVAISANFNNRIRKFNVAPERYPDSWHLPTWEETWQQIHADRKEQASKAHLLKKRIALT